MSSRFAGRKVLFGVIRGGTDDTWRGELRGFFSEKNVCLADIDKKSLLTHHQNKKILKLLEKTVCLVILIVEKPKRV